jgi:hypothetical protein
MSQSFDHLSPDCFRYICDFLSVHDIGHLHFTGFKTLLSKLSQTVESFNLQLLPRRPLKFPGILASLFSLRTLELTVDESFRMSLFIAAIDISILPPTIRSLNLKIANGFFALLQPGPNNTLPNLQSATMRDLDTLFPELTSLSFENSYLQLTDHSTFTLRFPSHLTFLSLPSSPSLDVELISSLSPSIVDLSFTATIPTTELAIQSWKKNCHFPPHLTKLQILQINRHLRYASLPHSLLHLTLSYNRQSPLKAKNWTSFPPKLVSFTLTNNTNRWLSQELILMLPSTLKLLSLNMQQVSSHVLEVLPQKLETFMLEPGTQILGPPVSIPLLPPTLTSIVAPFLTDNAQATLLPRSITRIRSGYSSYSIQSTSVISDLPPSLKEVWLDVIPDHIPWTSLVSLYIGPKTGMFNISSVIALNFESLVHLESLSIFGTDCTTFPFERLPVGTLKLLEISICEILEVDFSGPWASRLSKLDCGQVMFVSTSPKTLAMLTDAQREDNDRRNLEKSLIWLESLPHTLEHIKLGAESIHLSKDVGSDDLIPSWPPHLKSLRLGDVVAPSFWKTLPRSITSLLMGYDGDAPTLYHFMHDLPTKLSDCNLRSKQILPSKKELKKFMNSRKNMIKMNACTNFSLEVQIQPPPETAIALSFSKCQNSTDKAESLINSTPNPKKRVLDESANSLSSIMFAPSRKKIAEVIEL